MQSSFFRGITALGKVRSFSTANTSTLTNGVRVATAPTAGDASSVGLFLNVGGSHDNVAGTSTLLSRIAAAESSPAEGVLLTSFADREQMGIVAHGADVNKSVEVLARAHKAMVGAKDLETHRQALLAEHDGLTLNSESLLMDHLHSIAFQDTRLATPLAGTSKTVSEISAQSIEDHVTKHVTGSRAVVAAAGNVNHEEVAAAAMSAFGSIPELGSYSLLDEAPVEYTGSCLQLRDEAYEVLSCFTALKGVSVTDADALKMKVVTAITGHWNRSLGDSSMSSYPLALSNIEEGEGAATHIHTFAKFYRSTGLVGGYTLSDRLENDDAIYFILKEFVRLGSSVPTTEVNRAKLKVHREALAKASSSQSLAQDMGLQILSTGDYQTPDAVAAELEGVSRDDIREFAFNYFTDVDPVVVGSGPTAHFPDFNHIRGWTYQNRL